MRVRLGWACENSHPIRMARIAAAMFVMLWVWPRPEPVGL